MRPRVHAPVPPLRGQSTALSAAMLAAMLVASAAAASGSSVEVEPSEPLPVGTQTLTVTGLGFDPAGNRGNGVYVVFGPITPAPAYYLDPSIYAAFKWVHPGAQESGAESPMAADGSFATTLEVPSSFVGPTGPIDCSTVPCAVITFGAHGSQDRSQDTCTSVIFVPVAASGPPVPGASAPSGGLVQASGVVSPSGSVPPVDPAASPVYADPCDALGVEVGS